MLATFDEGRASPIPHLLGECDGDSSFSATENVADRLPSHTQQSFDRVAGFTTRWIGFVTPGHSGTNHPRWVIARPTHRTLSSGESHNVSEKIRCDDRSGNAGNIIFREVRQRVAGGTSRKSLQPYSSATIVASCQRTPWAMLFTRSVATADAERTTRADTFAIYGGFGAFSCIEFSWR
jgi:hypothetical protein